jgi:hypothetical protein
MARSRSSRQRPNVVHRGQRATLNGKPVIADGKGNWVAVTKGTYGNAQYGGKKAGSYKPGENRKSTPAETKSIPAKDRPADMRKGQVYGNDSKSHGRNWSNPHGQVSDKPSEGDRSTWATKKTKPKPRVSTTVSSTSTKKPVARKAQSKDMDANYKAWAKANPGLAKKVKKGQSGYKAINSSSKAAKPSDGQNLKSGPTPPKRTSLKTTPAKPADKKPAKQKPLTVPTNKIPKNLSGAAGKKYLADLDAGKLTRKRK